MGDPQRTFDKVARHLLKQGKRASFKGAVFEGCKYRTPDGLKCAIGCLIPDELYSLEMEGLNVVMLLADFPHLRAVPEIDHQDALLDQLQSVHDGNLPECWTDELRQVAANFQLSTTVLDGE